MKKKAHLGIISAILLLANSDGYAAQKTYAVAAQATLKSTKDSLNNVPFA